MATKDTNLAYEQLRRKIAGGDLAPVYMLHGEEGYYIDELTKLLEEAVPEEERAFDQYVVYGADTDPETVANLCHNYPVLGKRLVVIAKEIQNWREGAMEKLLPYVQKPVPTTVLVLASRGKTVKSAKLEKAIMAARGEWFVSEPIKEKNLHSVVGSIIKSKKLNIEEKGLAMLCDYVGTDLSRIYNQVEKLTVALEPGAMITPEVIERNIGISKDYNLFELTDAIAVRDAARAVRIIEYFRANPKPNPAVMVPATLFGHFSNLLIYHFTRDKSPSSVMAALGLKWQSQVARIEKSARYNNVRQVIEIISALREADVATKGFGSRQDPYDILRDLVFVILNCQGVKG